MIKPKNGGNWGIFGGRFDPVHLGHLQIAEQVCNYKKLTGILFVPSFNHPLKKDKANANFEQRCDMLKLAFEDYEQFCLSEIELNYELSGFTIDTIKKLKDIFASCTFYFIIGADNMHQFQQWYKPDEILKEAEILLAARPGYELKIIENLPKDRIEIIETDLFDISSTELRKLLEENTNSTKLNNYIPPKVLDYIRKNALYKS